MSKSGGKSSLGAVFVILFLCLFGWKVVVRIAPILGIILMLGGIAAAVGFIVLLVALLTGNFKKSTNDSKKQETSSSNVSASKPKAAQNQSLAEARKLVLDGKLKASRIKNLEVRKVANETFPIAEKIIKTLGEHPEDISDARQFLKYYLPTIDVILEKYETMEHSGADLTEMTQKVLLYFKDIKKALEKQFDSLFQDDMLDLSVEMEALSIAFKRDGLITDSDIKEELDKLQTAEEKEELELTI